MNVSRLTCGLLLSAGLVTTPIAAEAQALQGLLDHGAVVAHPAAGRSPLGAGYPAWYRDYTNQALDPCFSTTPSPDPAAGGAPMCFPTAPDPLGFAGNWGPEAFYFLADTTFPIPGAGDVRFTAALEASYATLQPTKGQEAVFSRIRLRGNSLPDGTYRLTHPYGVDTMHAVAGSGIFWTRDVGFTPQMFDLPLAGDVGPFLQWSLDNQPGGPAGIVPVTNIDNVVEQYLGDPNIAHAVTGSPFRTNYVKLEYSGDGGATWQVIGGSDQFFVVGKRHTAPIALPIRVPSATYARAAGDSLAAGVDVVVRALPSLPDVKVPPQSQMTLSGVGMPDTLMTYLGGIDWQAHVDFTNVLPTVVTVTNHADNNATATAQLTDSVVVGTSSFSATDAALTVKAISSDRKATGMTANGHAMTPTTVAGEFQIVIPSTLPPQSVRVASAPGGGTGVATVDVRPLNDVTTVTPLAAVDDVASTNEDVAVSINVTANDTGLGTGPVVLTIGRAPVRGTAVVQAGAVVYTPAANLNGADSFTYTVTKGGVTTAPATVTVNVAAVNDAPTTVADSVSVAAGASTTLAILANDTDVDGVINPASVVLSVAPPAGMTITANAATGVVSVVTTAATPAGTYVFSYTVADSTVPPARSASTSMTVVVTQAADAITMSGTPTYTVSGRKWDIRGTSNRGGVTITAYNCGTAGACAVIGSAVTGGNGAFALSPTMAAGFVQSAVISLSSSGGGVRNNVAIQTK